MIAHWIVIRVRPEERERFLRGITEDATLSERDEPGCIRFDVYQDTSDQDVYYVLEIYEDEVALKLHRESQGFAAWASVRDTVIHPTQKFVGMPIVPAGHGYWQKRKPE